MTFSRRRLIQGAAGLLVLAGAGELVLPERTVWALDRTMLGQRLQRFSLFGDRIRTAMVGQIVTVLDLDPATDRYVERSFRLVSVEHRGPYVDGGYPYATAMGVALDNRDQVLNYLGPARTVDFAGIGRLPAREFWA